MKTLNEILDNYSMSRYGRPFSELCERRRRIVSSLIELKSKEAEKK